MLGNSFNSFWNFLANAEFKNTIIYKNVFMKNKKLIGVVIVILIITVGVISWMFAKKSQQLPIQIQKEVTAQPIASVQQIQPEAQAIPSDETVNWQTYKNERFGFELKTPTGLESQYIETNFGVGKQRDRHSYKCS
jgi:hypothetical protein